MKARGRFLCALIALGIAVCSLPGLWIGVSAQSTALYAQSSRYSKQNQGREYVVSYTFDKAVGTAGEDLSAQADKLIVNGTALSGVDGVSISVSAEDTRSIEAVFPAEAEAGGEPLLEEGEGTDNLITLLGGFGGSSGNVTTAKIFYRYRDGARVGTRVYRSDDLSDYRGVSVTSISVPEIQSSNLCLYVYFSDVLCDRKMVNFQVRDLAWMKATQAGSYTTEELDLYHQFGLISEDNEESIIYKVLFGCDSYQGLEGYPGNNNGTAYDMTPQGQVNGLDMYTVYQVQEQTADSTLPGNGGSQQELVVQIHLEDNHMQIILKGDSTNDESLNENIAPDVAENMALSLKAGLMFPNGSVLKEDVSFYYDPAAMLWYNAAEQAAEPPADETLSNQEGYTAEELAALAGGGEGSGCGSAVFAGNVAAAAVLTGSAAVLCTKRRER